MNWNRIELVSVKKRTRDCKKWILTDLLGTKKGQTAQCGRSARRGPRLPTPKTIVPARADTVGGRNFSIFGPAEELL